MNEYFEFVKYIVYKNKLNYVPNNTKNHEMTKKIFQYWHFVKYSKVMGIFLD